ncbi:hypothetical protein EDD15DRAFT_1398967 [Pisolithus albus]|nr:hypothetical protein EDD15DRAFT_1398967 [Pisolithus albus]
MYQHCCPFPLFFFFFFSIYFTILRCWAGEYIIPMVILTLASGVFRDAFNFMACGGLITFDPGHDRTIREQRKLLIPSSISGSGQVRAENLHLRSCIRTVLLFLSVVSFSHFPLQNGGLVPERQVLRLCEPIKQLRFLIVISLLRRLLILKSG